MLEVVMAHLLITIGSLLVFVPMLILPFFALYFIIKKAVKDGILEAHNRLNNDNNKS